MYEQINSKIIEIDKKISDNIIKLSDDRGLLSSNILGSLRTLIEHIFLKIFMVSQDREIEITYPNIQLSIKYVCSRGELSQFRKFHKLLQISTSHYSNSYDGSERLILNYYEYLLYARKYCKTTLFLEIFNNLDDFPINTDETYKEYYEKISSQIERYETSLSFQNFDDRYYVQKVKPFFIDRKIYYEVTLSTANDYASKFDRIIAFTKYKVLPNYSIKVRFKESNIQIFGKTMPIKIIIDWMVSIRNCEIKNFSNLLGLNVNVNNNMEFFSTMKYLTESNSSLIDLADLDNKYYTNVYDQVHLNNRSTHLFDLLNKIREMTNKKSEGINILRYLLLNMNNKIIKTQRSNWPNNNLSDLYIENGSIPFERMPFSFSLKGHNTRLHDIFECIDSSGREHEILARTIKNNTEINGQIYTKIEELTSFSNVEALAKKYNKLLHHTHTAQSLMIENNLIYIYNYEFETIQIIKRLKELTRGGVKNYSRSFESWLDNKAYIIDCDDKKTMLLKMFEQTKLALIYGSAGTGKSTLVNHISNFFGEQKKIYLANTHPAVENLRSRVNASNTSFSTIAKFKSRNNLDTTCDILIIDESSTVSNSDILKVLEKADFKLLILVGDIYQIESIIFGNWFYLAKGIIDPESIHELKTPWRSKNNKQLQALWDKVRNIDDDIVEYLSKHNYSNVLDESVFSKDNKDEIILCLNYDGLYGINNINRILQLSNPNPMIAWGIWEYKVDDPILFNESERFSPVIHNNLKGTIRKIVKIEGKIWFDIEIDKSINALDIGELDLELLDNDTKDKSLVRFFVNQYKNSDDDNEINKLDIVPFQIAYAVSMHKAQGLEFDSVKIVITNEIEERIKHNIFYTAITRTKNKLKIYWTAECQTSILKNLEHNFNNKDEHILLKKINNH